MQLHCCRGIGPLCGGPCSTYGNEHLLTCSSVMQRSMKESVPVARMAPTSPRDATAAAPVVRPRFELSPCSITAATRAMLVPPLWLTLWSTSQTLTQKVRGGLRAGPLLSVHAVAEPGQWKWWECLLATMLQNVLCCYLPGLPLGGCSRPQPHFGSTAHHPSITASAALAEIMWLSQQLPADQGTEMGAGGAELQAKTVGPADACWAAWS